MTQYRLSCQTITYGDDQSSRFPTILAKIADAGYDGVEIGFRRFSGVSASDMKAMLSDHGLVLSGSHIGGNLEDLDQAEEERSGIMRVLDYLETVGASTLMYSNLQYETESDMPKAIAQLNETAELCATRGINLLYHNHAWEAEDDALVLRVLLEHGSDALGFCPDVGWIAKGSLDPIGVLELLRPRMRMVHFKDFASLNPGVDTVELGDGVVPLSEIATWLGAAFDDLWIVSEQDISEKGADTSIQTNAQYLKTLLS